MAKAKVKERPVLICTEYRGVFFGYADDTSGDVVQLNRARNIRYWPTACCGFMGLATKGPLSGSKVGPAGDIQLRKVTAVVECTPEAVALFEAHPCN